MNLLSHLLSGLVGLIVGVLLEEPLNRAKKSIVRIGKRLFFHPKHTRRPPSSFCFGPLTTSWIVVDGYGELEYAPETIETHYIPKEIDLPQELRDQKKRIEQRENERRQKGLPSLWNGIRYNLDGFSLDRTPLEENLSLQLRFRPTDYFTFLATNMSLDAETKDDGKVISFREKYLSGADWQKPVRFFSNSFGVNLAVVTSDSYIVLTRRSGTVGSRPGAYNVSVNEGLSRLLDRSDRSDAPDVYRCAIRGAAEELGIELKRSDISLLSFGVDKQYCQWGLLGMAKANRRAEEILRRWRAGVKDKWESPEVYAIPFDTDSVVQFVLSRDPWAAAGLACIYHVLVHQFGRPRVEAAIREHSNP